MTLTPLPPHPPNNGICMIVVRQLSSSFHKYHQKQEISSQALNIRVSHLIIVILGTVKFALGGKMLLITLAHSVGICKCSVT